MILSNVANADADESVLCHNLDISSFIRKKKKKPKLKMKITISYARLAMSK